MTKNLFDAKDPGSNKTQPPMTVLGNKWACVGRPRAVKSVHSSCSESDTTSGSDTNSQFSLSPPSTLPSSNGSPPLLSPATSQPGTLSASSNHSLPFSPPGRGTVVTPSIDNSAWSKLQLHVDTDPKTLRAKNILPPPPPPPTSPSPPRTLQHSKTSEDYSRKQLKEHLKLLNKRKAMIERFLAEYQRKVQHLEKVTTDLCIEEVYALSNVMKTTNQDMDKVQKSIDKVVKKLNSLDGA